MSNNTNLTEHASAIEEATVNIDAAAEQLGISPVYLRTILSKHEGACVEIHGKKFVTKEFVATYAEQRVSRSSELQSRRAAKAEERKAIEARKAEREARKGQPEEAA